MSGFWGGISTIFKIRERKGEGREDMMLVFRFLIVVLIKWEWMRSNYLETCILGPIIGREKAMWKRN